MKFRVDAQSRSFTFYNLPEDGTYDLTNLKIESPDSCNILLHRRSQISVTDHKHRLLFKIIYNENPNGSVIGDNHLVLPGFLTSPTSHFSLLDDCPDFRIFQFKGSRNWCSTCQVTLPSSQPARTAHYTRNSTHLKNTKAMVFKKASAKGPFSLTYPLVTPDLPLTLTLTSSLPAFIHTISISSLYDILKVSNKLPAEHCNEVTAYRVDKEIEDSLTLDIVFHTHSNLPSSATYPIAVTYHKTTTDSTQPLKHQVLFLSVTTATNMTAPRLEDIKESRDHWRQNQKLENQDETFHPPNWLDQPQNTGPTEETLFWLETGRTPPNSQIQLEVKRIKKLLNAPLTQTNYIERMLILSRLEARTETNRTVYKVTMEMGPSASPMLKMNTHQLNFLQLKPNENILLSTDDVHADLLTVTHISKLGENKMVHLKEIYPTRILDALHWKTEQEYNTVQVRKLASSFTARLQLKVLNDDADTTTLLFPNEHKNYPNQVNSIQQLSPEQAKPVAKIMGSSSSIFYPLLGCAGSGKTRTAVEIVLQFMKQGKTTLATAPTNEAADSLLTKLIKASSQHQIKGDIRRLATRKHDTNLCQEFCFMTDTVHSLPSRKELTGTAVFVTTIACAGRLGYSKYGKLLVDLILVDEAGFLPEFAVLPAILPFLHHSKTPKILLVGDTHQLTYTPHSVPVYQYGGGKSILHRIANSPSFLRDHSNLSVLRHNYRNPPPVVSLMNAISYHTSYGGGIIAMKEPSSECNLFAVHVEGNSTKVHTSSVNLPELYCGLNLANDSTNPNEDKTSIVVYYAGQRSSLQDYLEQRGLDNVAGVYSTESVQGSESSTVVVSTCAAFDPKTLEAKSGSWAHGTQRALVALSRAKDKYYLVGNLFVLSTIQPYKVILEKICCQGTIVMPERLKPYLYRRLFDKTKASHVDIINFLNAQNRAVHMRGKAPG